MRIRLDIPLSLSAIARAVGGTLLQNDAIINAVCTDSREVSSGELFVALRGEHTDGNDFVDEVISKGAYALGRSGASIFVYDTKEAILRLAEEYRSKLPCLRHTVAITGSVGKTTTKELTSRLLSGSYRVHSTYGNFNNDLGIFHTVLSAKKDTEVLVIEMGMNHRGEISRLSRTARPDIALITNVGTAHIGNLGTRAAIAAAKLEITDGMQDGVLLLPYGEPLFDAVEPKCAVSVNGNAGDYRLHVHGEGQGETVFSFTGINLLLENESVALLGEHLMSALAFALSAADTLGVTADKIRPALASINEAALRQRRIKIGRYDIYDDTYSSSAEAVIAVIKALTNRHEGGVSALLGDMLELGRSSARLHRTVGEVAAKCKIRRLYLFGKFAGQIAEGALAGGMSKDCIFINEELACPERTARQIRESYGGELLVVKASHAVHAERIYDFLKD